MKKLIFFCVAVFCGVLAFLCGQMRNVEQACLASTVRTDNGIEITSAIMGGPMTAAPLPDNAALQVAQAALAPRPARKKSATAANGHEKSQPTQVVSHAFANRATATSLTVTNLVPPDIAQLRPGQTVCLADGACEPVIAVVPLRTSWLVRTSAHSGQFGRAGGTIAPTPETSRIMGVVR